MFYIVSTCFSIYHVSIISAIFSHKVSELNSKSYLLKGGTAISSGADMNDYTTPGNYYCISDSAAITLKNCPFTHAFTLKVEHSRGISVPCQTFREYHTGITAYRKYESSSWKGYAYFSDDATVFAGTAINSGDDLDDYKTPGIYYSASSSITSSLSNVPETFSSGFAMLVFPMSANISQVIYTGGSGGVMYTRSTITSGFQKWYKFQGILISS